jgi:hypothetical protein
MISLMEFVAICGVATLTAAGASRGLYLFRRLKGQGTHQAERPAEQECSGRPSAGAWHEPRYGKRHTIRCPIRYVLGNERHEGMLTDMSQRGWRAEAVSPMLRGTAMPMQILCSGQPIMIEEAVVRWTDGMEFGVEVTSMSPEAAARLSEYLTRNYPHEEPQSAYALSPFSYN